MPRILTLLASSLVILGAQASALAAPQVSTQADPLPETGSGQSRVGPGAASPTGLDCESRGLGDYFYCEGPVPETEPSAPPAPPSSDVPAASPAPQEPPEVAALHAYQADLEQARKVAVWNPTPANLRRYQELQLVTMEKSEAFAESYMVNTWQVPGLAYDATVPVNAMGKTAWKSNRKAAQRSHLKSVSERYGLMYFYSSACAACRVFSPTLREFAATHGFEVMAISTDGGPSATFPDWRPDNGIAREVGLDGGVTPALLLFDAATAETIALGFGVMGRDDLETRIFQLTGGRTDGFTGALPTR